MRRIYSTLKNKIAGPLLSVGLLSAFLTAGPAVANPSGGSVQSGNVNIQQVGPNTLQIDQLTQKAIIDWQQFGINPGETVNFNQLNNLSVILNRVVGNDPSHILGTMNANGNVFLINPNGILFGPNSVVNVGGLVASTLNMTNEDFLNGNFRFTQDQNKMLASVINKGSITITDGGYAVLMAPLVSNEGMIVANLGKVNLVSGESATLNFDGRNLISYDIGAMKEGKAGTVVVSRDTVSDLLANVITDPNLTEAGGLIENADGTVSLVGASGTTINEGTISANGKAGKKAGKVVLDSGRLTVVGNNAVVEASGTGVASDGGEVLALSDGTLYTTAGSRLEAKGSDLGGDGGFVETSGTEHLLLRGMADASAALGEAGEWLIDPEFLTITEAANGVGGLDGSTDTTGLGNQIDTISTGYLESLGAGTNVILQADNQITINDLSLNGGALTFQPGVSVEFRTTTGDLLFADRNDRVVVQGSGNITTNIGRDIYLGVFESRGTGTIELNYGRDLIDGNGAGVANIVGDRLTFTPGTGGLQTDIGALEVAGWTNSNPLEMTFNVANGRVIDLISVGGANGNGVVANNLDLTAGGALTSDAGFQAAPTIINVTKTGALSIGAAGFSASEATLTATGNVSGGTLNANTATVTGSNVNGLTTDVADLTVTANGGTLNVNTNTATNTRLALNSNNSTVTVDGAVVAPAGSNQLVNFTDAGVATNFSLTESANRNFEIGAITMLAGGQFALQTAGNIADTAGTGLITSDTIALRSTGGTVGDLTGALPINVTGTATGSGGTANATALTVAVANGDANVVHTDTTAVLTFDGTTNVLDGADTGGVSFTELNFEKTGAGDVNVNVLGAAGAALTSASVRAVGNILDAQADGNGGALNIAADTLTLTSSTGSVGTAADEIEVQTQNLTASGPGGVFIGNTIELEVFNLVSQITADARISATNGTLQLTGGTLTTPTAITDTNGDTNADGRGVIVNVDVTGGDLTIGNNVMVTGQGPFTGASTNEAFVNIVNQTGNIVGAGPLTATNAEINLQATNGSIGAGSQLAVTTGAGSALTATSGAAGGTVGIALTGNPDTATFQHNNGTLNVTGALTATNAGGLTVTGAAGTNTLTVQNTGNGAVPLTNVTNNGTANVNLIANGDITGTVDGTDDIVTGAGAVNVTTTGAFAADATGNLNLEQVGGNATVQNNNGLTLSDSDGANSVGGNLVVNNNSALTVGQLQVGGTATFNQGAGASVNDDGDGTVDLIASALNITTTAVGTTFDLETTVNDVTITDAAPGGDGTFIVTNSGNLGTVTIDSNSSDNINVSTGGAANSLTLANGALNANNPAITTLNITERTDNVVAAANTVLTSTNDTTITTTTGTVTGGEIQTNGNLTIASQGLVNVTTAVGGILNITSQAGTIDFTDSLAAGPTDVLVRTVAGQNSNGTWSTGTLTYVAGTDALDVTNGGANDTNVTFQTDTDGIVIGQANVGNATSTTVPQPPGADLTLISTGAQGGTTNVGEILDNGENVTVDVIANNATLLATNTIGTVTDPIETDVSGTLTARSDTSGVFLAQTTTVTHLIIDVLNSDYNSTFLNSDGTNTTVDYDATSGQLSVTDSGGGNSAAGTDLTLIERSTTNDVDIFTDIDVNGGSSTTDFVRILSGRNITNTTNRTITAANVDLISETGNIGSATNAIVLRTLDLCVSARGRDAQGFVYNDGSVRNLFLNVNQSTGGAGNVQVGWSNGGDRGVTMNGGTLTSTAAFTQNGTAVNAANVDEAQTYVMNGRHTLNGTFNTPPTGNTETFARNNALDTGANVGGDVNLGNYVAVDTNNAILPQDTYLEVRATNGGNIDQVAGTVDLTNGGTNAAGGDLTLVSHDGNIGSINQVQVTTDGDATQRTTVNAYTTNGDINVNGSGNITYNEVYAGSNVDVLAPAHDNNGGGFVPGGIGPNGTTGNPGIVPEQNAGNVTLTAAGEICANDIIAGSFTAAGNVTITSTAAGDIVVGNILAQGDTVTLNQTVSGSVLEKTNEDGTPANDNTEIVAGTLVANLQGPGNIGFRGTAASKKRDAFDMVVTNATVNTTDGGVYLRNVGNIIWDLVDAESSTGEDVYLLSEGVTFANNVRVGDDAGSDMDLLIETSPGSDLLVGRVQAIGNTATLLSTDRIRTDGTVAHTGIQADRVLLVAERGIGVNGNNARADLQLEASTAGGTVTVAARTNVNNNGGPGSVYLAGRPAGVGNATNIEIGTVVDNICNLSATGITNAVNVCVDATSGNLVVNEDIVANNDIALEATGDVTLGDNDATDFTQTTNDGTLVTVTRNNGRLNADGDDVGVESTGGSIIDGNGANNNINANRVVLRANTNVGTAADGIEITGAQLAAQAVTGELNINDTAGGLQVFQDTTTNILKSNTDVLGVQAALDLCLETAGALTQADNGSVIAGGANTSVRAGGNIDIDATISSGGGAAQILSVQSTGGSIRDSGAGTDLDAGDGNLVLSAAGGIGSDAGGANNNALEVNAAVLAANAANGDVDINDTAGNLTTGTVALGKGGGPITGVTASVDVCLQTAGTLTVAAGNNVTATNGNVAMESVGNTTIQGVVTAGDDVSIETTAGSILDDNGEGTDAVVAADTVILQAVGGTSDIEGGAGADDDFEISGNNLAASAGRNLDIDTTGAINIVSTDTLKTAETIDGLSAAGELCLDVAGALNVNANVASTGGDVNLRSNDNIVIGNGAGAVETVSAAGQATIESTNATGTITANNGAASVPTNTSVAATDVLLIGQGGIGNGAGNDIGIRATNLAANGGTGDVRVVDQSGDLTLTSLTSGKTPTVTVNGVDAAGTICLDVLAGALNLGGNTAGINAQGGDPTAATVALRASGDVNLANNAGTGSLVATNKISIQSGGNLVDGMATDNTADLRTTNAAGEVVIRADGNGGVGQAGNELEVQTGTFAARSGQAVDVLGLGGDLTIGEIALEKSGGTITGVTAVNEICIDIVAGNLTVANNIQGAGDVALRSRTGNVANNIATAGQNITATGGAGRVSVEAGGEITDGNSAQGALVATNVVLDAANGIGDEAGTGDVQIDATRMAARTTAAGSVNIQDIAGGVTVANGQVTAKGNQPIDGITAVEDVCLDVVGDLNVTANITAGDDVAIRSTGNTVLGNGGTGVITATGNTGGGVVTIESTGNVTDGNGAATNIIAQDGAGNNTGDLAVVAGSFGDATFNAGGAATGDAIEIDVARFAASTTAGDVNVADQSGNLEIAEALGAGVFKGSGPISGIDATADICVDVIAGTLAVTSDIDSTGGSIALASAGDITLGDDAGAERGTITAPGTTISVESRTGSISDGQTDDGAGISNATSLGGNVVMRGATGVGDATAPGTNVIEIDTLNFAADGGTGDANYQDLDTGGDGLTVSTLRTLKDGIEIIGVTAQDICITGVNVVVDDNVTAQRNVLIRGTGSVTLGDNSGTDLITAGADTNQVGTVSIEAQNGSVIDNNDVGGVVQTNVRALGVGNNEDGNVVIIANNGGIGSDAAGANDNVIEIDAQNFAASATNGDVNILDVDTNSNGLNITRLNPLKTPGAPDVIGVSAGREVCIDVANGAINVLENITSGTNGAGASQIALRTQGAASAITVGNGDGDVLTANNGGQISLEAGGNIVDANGAGASAAVTTGTMVFDGARVNGDSAADGEFEIDAANLAARATAGEVNVEDRSGDLTIVAATTGKGNVPITGITAVNEICVDVLLGALNVNENVTSDNGPVALRAQAGNLTVGNGDGDVVTANNGGQISLEASGDIVDNNGAGASAAVTTGTIVLDGARVNGDSAADGEFELEAATLAARATAGEVNVEDRTGDLTIGTATTGKGNTPITGITAVNEICVDVLAGALNVNENITSDNGPVALRATGNVTIGNGDADVVTANNGGQVSIESGAAILDNNTANTAAVVTTGTVVLDGTTINDNAGNGAFEIAGGTLAARATANQVLVDDLTGDLVIGAGTTGKGNTPITGVTAVNEICVDVLLGALNVNENVTSDNGPVALRAQAGNLTVGNADGDVVTANNGGQISLEASGDIVDNNGAGASAAVTTGTIVFDGARVNGDSAADGEFELEAATLAARATAGEVNVEDRTGDLTIGTATTRKGNNAITGITAVNEICVDVVLGALNVNENITSTNGPVALRALTGVVVGNGDADVITANNGGQVSIEAEGNILDNNTANTAAVVTTGTIVLNGASINDNAGNGAFEIAGGTLAARASVNQVLVDDLNGDLVIGAGTTGKGNTPITGVTAVNEICVDVLLGALNVNENVTSDNGPVALRAQAGNLTVGNGDGDVVTANNGGQISLEASGDIVDNNGAGASAAVTTGTIVLDGARVNGDSAADGEFELEAATLAARATAGEVNVEDRTGDLTIGTATTRKGNNAITGITAVNEICVDVLAGALNVNENITSANGPVALRATGDVTIGNGDADVVTANNGGQVSIESGGAILDNNTANTAAVVTTGTVVLDGTTINDNAGNGAFEIAGGTLAARATANQVLVDDLNGDLVIGAGTTGKGNTPITGVTAVNEICVDVLLGALNVNENVTSDNGPVALRAQAGNLTVGNGDGDVVTANNGGQISLEASGDIVDNNGAGASAAVTTGTIVLDGARVNGDSAADGEFELEAATLAARATAGEVNVEDRTGDLTIGTATTRKGNNAITGITAVNEICVDVLAGALNVNENITSANGPVALRATGDVTIGNGDVDVVTANNGGQVSIESGAAILDNNTANTAAVVTTGTVVLDGTTINDNAGNGAFEIAGGTLAARATANQVLVDDLNGDLVIGAGTTGKGNTPITGVTAVNEICVDVLLGALNVNENVTSDNGPVALRAQAGNLTVGNGDGDVVTANNGGQISLEASGDIVDNNGAGASAAVTTGTIVFDGARVNGDSAADGEFELEAATLAARATAGEVNVEDRTGDLTIGTATTRKGNNAITGITAVNEICVDVLAGALNVNENITSANGPVALRATGDVTIGNGDADVVTANNGGQVSIESGAAILDNNTANTAAVVTTGTVVLDGTTINDNAGNGAFEIEAGTLAARASTGQVNVTDRTGNLVVGTATTGKGNATISGVTAATDVCVEVLAGNLQIENQIVATNNNVALRASGNVNNSISNAENVTAGNTISVEAGNEITDDTDAQGSFNATNVVLDAANGIGDEAGTVDVEIDATNFAARTAAGSANINDINGGATVAAIDTLKGNNTITGVTAAQDVCLDIVNGDLTINEAVTATAGTAAIRTTGNIASNATTTGGTKVSVESGGGITDGNAGAVNFAGPQTVISAAGNVGAKADSIEIESDTAALRSTGGEVNVAEATGNLNLATIALEKNGGNVAGITASTDVCIDVADGTLNYDATNNVVANNEIAIRTRDSLVLNAPLTTGNSGKVSIEVTNGDITDNNTGIDITTGDAVLKASGNIGEANNAVELSVNRLAAEGTTGRVNLHELNGVKVSRLELAKNGGFVDGITAGTDASLRVAQGDLQLGAPVTAGGNVELRADSGNIVDCNGNANNVTAGGNVVLAAPLGCVGVDGDTIEVVAGGSVTIIERPGKDVFPPGTFAQSNVNLGEHSFYLDYLIGYLRPEAQELIIDELNGYNFLEDADFLLEKHPEGANDDDEEENK